MHALLALQMMHRIPPTAILFGCLFLQAAPACAATVFAQLFPLTGEIRLVNRTTAPLPIVFYSIKSNSGALTPSPSVWKSIQDNYDAPFGMTPGNGFVDADDQWVKISSTSMELAEGPPMGDGGTLLPWRPVSLGRIWNPNARPTSDLIFDIRSQAETYNVFVLPFSLDGDYFADGVVNQTDYNTWRQYFGSTSVLLADGNIDGVINAADYVVWRNNLGASIPATGLGENGSLTGSLLGASAVPEPSAVILCLAACGGLLLTLRRGGR